MSAPVSLVVDNEPVSVLMGQDHGKHRSVLARLEAAARLGATILVPVAVRVEAGWDRRAPANAHLNRLMRADAALDAGAADRAVRFRRLAGVSVVDAAVGAAAETAPKPVVILTSDLDDMTAIADHIDGDVRLARL